MLQHSRLTYSGIAAYLDVAAAINGGVNGGNTFVSRQHHVADPIADISKRVAGSLGERGTSRRVPPVAGKAKRLTPEVLDQSFASAVTATRRDLQRKLDQSLPEVPGAQRII